MAGREVSGRTMFAQPEQVIRAAQTRLFVRMKEEFKKGAPLPIGVDERTGEPIVGLDAHGVLTRLTRIDTPFRLPEQPDFDVRDTPFAFNLAEAVAFERRSRQKYGASNNMQLDAERKAKQISERRELAVLHAGKIATELNRTFDFAGMVEAATADILQGVEDITVAAFEGAANPTLQPSAGE